MTILAIMLEVGITYDSISTILHDQPHLSNVSAQWVPERVWIVRPQCYLCVMAMKRIFYDRLVTMDECWLYHFDPETKMTS